MKNILIVDDEEDLLVMLRHHLGKAGYNVSEAGDGGKALDIINKQHFDLIILDVMMPGKDGYEVCQIIRAQGNKTPIIFLTAKTEEFEEVFGLEIGGDDFISKPFSIKALLSRVKAVIRRSDKTNEKQETIQIKGIEIRMNSYDIFVDKKKVDFPRKEFELLAFLAANPNKVFSRNTLLNKIWSDNVVVIDRTVDVHIGRIRKKLGPYRDLLETVVGVGYCCHV